MIKRIVILASAGIWLGLLAGCGPAWQQRGDAVGEARLTEAAFVTSDAVRLPLWSWPADGAPKSVILALHGFAQYGGQFRQPGADLSSSGHTVYAVDLRGNGGAPGRGLFPEHELLIDDVQALVAGLKAKHPETPIYLLGYSMGAAIAVDAMTRSDAPAINGLILVAPGLRSWRTLSFGEKAGLWLAANFAPSFEIDSWRYTPVSTDNEAVDRANRADPMIQGDIRMDHFYGIARTMDEAWTSAPRLDLPTLLMYGLKDLVIECTLVSDFAAILAASPAPSLDIVIYPDGYHLLLWDLAADKPLSDMDRWISGDRAPLSSPFRRAPDIDICKPSKAPSS